MPELNEPKLKFRCPPGLAAILPRPIPAVRGLPDWFKTMPQKAYNVSMGDETLTVKKCPPFIDAMTYGYLIPLAADLEVRDGEFSWNFELPGGLVSEYSHSPVDFHDPSQVAGSPFFDEDRFPIKFNNFWTVEVPEGYSLLFTHPLNRPDLPFTTLSGLVDSDRFNATPIHFPARWHDLTFNGVLPKGTPVAQCVPVKREAWDADFDDMSSEQFAGFIRVQDATAAGPGVYRREFRALKR